MRRLRDQVLAAARSSSATVAASAVPSSVYRETARCHGLQFAEVEVGRDLIQLGVLEPPLTESREQ
ncbi:hypothetical protein [Actinophytocola sp.]|uniref:hypothetical protein n=1 Tax=Actinophytocola sp. TaxID=1872138 RepID=UPI003D6A728A